MGSRKRERKKKNKKITLLAFFFIGSAWKDGQDRNEEEGRKKERGKK